ncbi:MAG TPA: SAM-dependent methyltransferase [Rugosimonospora sp.]|nr:SAM-dependent methyltransferase [Rugosimonospora sp.]
MSDHADESTNRSLWERVDTSVAHPARRYDYWLGGKDNFAADRESGDRIAAAFPQVRTGAIENRNFLRRAVSYLAGEAGIDQFLDIGTGIPTSPNVHEIAQSLIPAARVAYADNDPIVLTHARALLTSSPDGVTTYLDADLRRPQDIMTHPDLAATLDLSRPVALILVAVLHFVPEEGDPYRIVDQLVGGLASGSYLVVSHGTGDFLPSAQAVRGQRLLAAEGVYLRDRAQVARFFHGLELIPPGIVATSEWRAENEPKPRPLPVETGFYGVVGRVP